MNTDVMFHSGVDQWSTPQDFYDELNKEFHFTLDPCADEQNHKCDTYFTKEQDGLKQDWSGHVVFCNPLTAEKKLVYGRKSVMRNL